MFIPYAEFKYTYNYVPLNLFVYIYARAIIQVIINLVDLHI